MRLVERILIKKHNKELIHQLEKVCFNAARLYNVCLFDLRQRFFNKTGFLSEYKISGQLAAENNCDYRNLPAQTAQQTIKQAYKDWKSFWKLHKKFKANPACINGRPKLPHYKAKDGITTAKFTGQSISVMQGFIHFPKKVIDPIKTTKTSICEVRIVPQSTSFIIEIVYNASINEEVKPDKQNFLSIDPGISNLVTAINNVGQQPFIINGRMVKAYNQWHNRLRAQNQSNLPKNRHMSAKIRELDQARYWWMEDKLHQISRIIINYCIRNNIGSIIIGKNKEWKSGVSLGSVNNQKFVQIPHDRLLEKIKYKAEMAGIDYKEIEEWYTSKCDALAMESIGKRECYLGIRIKRGLFKSSTAKIINADVNGALNIARKVIGDAFIGQPGSSAGRAPYRIDIL